MDDYAMRRKEYVQQIRASFDQSGAESMYSSAADETEETDTAFLSFKIRFAIAILLFGMVFFCHYHSYTIFGMEITEIIDIISDNQYDTFLKTILDYGSLRS